MEFDHHARSVVLALSPRFPGIQLTRIGEELNAAGIYAARWRGFRVQCPSHDPSGEILPIAEVVEQLAEKLEAQHEADSAI